MNCPPPTADRPLPTPDCPLPTFPMRPEKSPHRIAGLLDAPRRGGYDGRRGLWRWRIAASPLHCRAAGGNHRPPHEPA